MKYFFILILITTLLATAGTDVQCRSLSKNENFLIHLSKDINTQDIWIKYKIECPFGSYIGKIETKPDVWDYEIPLVYEKLLNNEEPFRYEDIPAESLKLLVYGQHYQARTFDFSSLGTREKSVEIKLNKLETIPFFGKILLQDGFDTEKFKVRVNYRPAFECTFFYELPGCVIREKTIAYLDIAKDGSFKTDLPGFARDSTITSFEEPISFRGNYFFNKGAFSLSLVDVTAGYNQTELGLKAQENGVREGLRILPNYPKETNFVIEGKGK